MPKGVLISAILTDDADIDVLRYDGVTGQEATVGASLRCALDGIDELKAAELVFPGTAMNAHALYEELSKCRPGIQIFGVNPKTCGLGC